MQYEKQDVERLRGRRRDADVAAGRAGFGAAEGGDHAVTAAGHFLHALAHHGKEQADREARGFPRRSRRHHQMDQLERRRRADRCIAGRQRRHPQYRNRQSAAAVGSHPRRRQGHRRHLGAADDADQPRRQYQIDQGLRPERQDRGADRQGLDAGDRAADRSERGVRRRPVVEARCQHRAARPSRCLCGDDQHASTRCAITSRSRRSRSSN